MTKTKTKTNKSKQGRSRTGRGSSVPKQKGFTNVPSPAIRFPQHIKTGMEIPKKDMHHKMVCNHAASYSASLANPRNPPSDTKIPLSGEAGGVPCSSNIVPRYAETTVTVPDGMNTLDLWFVTEGLQTLDEQDWFCGLWDNGGANQVYGGMGPLNPSGVPPISGVGLWTNAPGANTSFVPPNDLAAANTFGIYQNDVSQTWPTFANSDNGSTYDRFRLVSQEAIVAFAGRQQDIEGKVTSLCLFEKPQQTTTTQQVETDLSRRVKMLDSKRSAKIKFWPNCETPQWRDIVIKTVNLTTTRQRVKVTDLQAGDKLVIQMWMNYEIVRPHAVSSQTPTLLTRDEVHLKNALQIYAGRDYIIEAYVKAYKVVSYFVLFKV
jgi:hypothetical protein